MSALLQVGDSATPVEWHAPPHVRAALARLGRTEDIKFSPNNSRLALAAFDADFFLLFDVRVLRHGAESRLHLDDFAELRSDSFRLVHGFDFIGEGVLAVANRGGALTLVGLPPTGGGGRVFDVRPYRVIDRADADTPLRSPGSVCVSTAGLWCDELLVCDTFVHRVTRHEVSARTPLDWQTNAVVLEAELDTPDGLAVSPDGGTVAVSNHGRHEVLLFDRRRMSRTAGPVARLTGVHYPHGLHFSPDGRHLYTADGGRPFVVRYERPAGGWAGTLPPSAVVRVMSEAVYRSGGLDPDVSGPKGLHLTRDGALMAVTCEQQPLAVFAVGEVFG